jgi:uncharacterized membrane protein/ElaB/YqjD/DUF883 family membrane-anchored ribosome-binding protein/soluble cytochrome b562
MSDLSLIVLTTSSRDGAAQALDVAKKLDRDGWIELKDYVLLSKDEKGHVTAREMDDEFSEKVAAATVGVAGALVGGAIGGPVGVAAGAASGALVGAGSIRLMERLLEDNAPPDYAGLGADRSVLGVVVEEHYAERLDEELQKLGRTFRRELKRGEREAEFDAYVARSKRKLQAVQDDIQVQLARAQAATGAEKIKIEADLAAKRAELEAKREKLEDHIKEVNSGLKSDIREMNFRLELAGLMARSGIATGIDNLHRQLNHYNDELENLIEEQIDALKKETSELKAKADKATGETKAAIQNHLQAIESGLRKERAKLQDSFEERLLEMKQWFENLHVRSTLARAEVRDKLQASVKAAQHSLAELKARARMRNREDERSWKDIREGFNQAWRDLEKAFDQANRERA